MSYFGIFEISSDLFVHNTLHLLQPQIFLLTPSRRGWLHFLSSLLSLNLCTCCSLPMRNRILIFKIYHHHHPQNENIRMSSFLDAENTEEAKVKCFATISDFKDANENGPLLDSEWRCRVCKCLVAQHYSSTPLPTMPTAQASAIYLSSPPSSQVPNNNFLLRQYSTTTAKEQLINNTTTQSSDPTSLGRGANRYSYLQNATVHPTTTDEVHPGKGRSSLPTNAFVQANSPSNLLSSMTPHRQNLATAGQQSMKKLFGIKRDSNGEYCRINFVALLRSKLHYKNFEAPFECDKAIRIENINDQRDANSVNDFNRLNKLRRLTLTKNIALNGEGFPLKIDTPSSKLVFTC